MKKILVKKKAGPWSLRDKEGAYLSPLVVGEFNFLFFLLLEHASKKKTNSKDIAY